LAVAGITVFAVRSGDDAGDGSEAPASACDPAVGDAATAPAIGDPAPSFALPGLDGGCVRLADLRGQPVVVNFWASWCNPCRKEFPQLREANDQYRDDGLEVIGVTFRDIPFDSRRFAGEEHADWPLAVDEGELVAHAYRVTAVPQTLFIRRDGTISARIYGPFSARELDKEIGKILRERRSS